jgi:hypothetical protein
METKSTPRKKATKYLILELIGTKSSVETQLNIFAENGWEIQVESLRWQEMNPIVLLGLASKKS